MKIYNDKNNLEEITTGDIRAIGCALLASSFVTSYITPDLAAYATQTFTYNPEKADLVMKIGLDLSKLYSTAGIATIGVTYLKKLDRNSFRKLSKKVYWTKEKLIDRLINFF